MTDDLLDLDVPQQLQANWCWAATTVGVHRFVFGNTEAQALTQSFVVNRRLDRHDCCIDPSVELPKPCNVQSGLTLPLHEADCHRVTYANRISFDDIIKEIEQNAPVCVRVVWEQGFGEGHFAVIIGYIRHENLGIADVIVDDSLYGRSIQTYESFRRYYRTTVQNPDGVEQDEGRWTHTYFVPPQKPADQESPGEATG